MNINIVQKHQKNLLFKYAGIKTITMAAFSLFAIATKAQNPLPGIGAWQYGNQTTSLNDAGVGVTAPNGKMEVKYQPCQYSQNGLVVTSLGCDPGYTTLQPNSNMNNIDGVFPGPNGGTWPTWTGLNSITVYTVTPISIPLVKSNDKPMLWLRDENPASTLYTSSGNPVAAPASYETKFIVMPDGKTGINVSNPRAQLDVVQFKTAPSTVPTASFGKIAGGTATNFVGTNEAGTPTTVANIKGYRTTQILIYNNLPVQSFNRIVQAKDQAILFTDGMNANGSNQNGALVIAPWDPNYLNANSTVGGIRINKQGGLEIRGYVDGNMEVRGNIRATKLTVNAQWWPDFVFSSDYKLMPLNEVKGFITQNGHLPGIPSQDSIVINGQDIADLQRLQQQKIEELTLYTIAQEEKQAQQAIILKLQEERLKSLETKLNTLNK